jgi:peptidoglycan/LPS O-acetylase OafA/YrhL
MVEKSDRHIDSLDGLRGIAILLVFLFHYLPRNPSNPLSLVASLGWTGVDLFFVLSGFLITGILYQSVGMAGYFTVFYIRRALRLLPLYCLAVAIVLSVAATLHTRMTWQAIPFYIYGANIVLATKHGAPDFTPYFNCVHFWSLSLEEQFYSLWPLAIFFVRRRRPLMQICAIGILGTVIIRTMLTHSDASTWLLYSELPSRMDSLLVGAMLALCVRGRRGYSFLSTRALSISLGVFCVALSTLFAKAGSLYFASKEMTSFGYSLIAGVYGCLLGLALKQGTLANSIGRIPLLRFFGRYSYGLYVWHDLPSPICNQWIVWFTRHIHPPIVAQMAYTATMLSLFTGISVLSYELFEVRFLKLKARFKYAVPGEK